MKITHLLEGSEAGMPSPTQPAPKFGRSDDRIEETTVAGNVGGGAPTNMGMQRRGKGSMFQGIKTSKKFANTPVTEDDISEEHLGAKQRREEFFNKSQSRDIGKKPESRDIMAKEGFNGEYDDEAGMFKNNLQTIQRVSMHLEKAIANNENLPEWVQEKIATAKGMIVSAMDYMISQHENGETYTVDEGYYSNYDNNRTGFRKPRPDVTGEEEPSGMFTVMINGRAWKEFTSNIAFQRAKTLADKYPSKHIQVRWPNGSLNTVKEGQWQDIDSASAPPKGAKLQTKTIEPGSAIRVDPNYKEPVAKPKDNGMGRIVQGTWQADPKGKVRAPSGDPEGVQEVAPPSKKAERMVKHIKKSYGKDGKITPKEKSIAYATAWKAHNKSKVKEESPELTPPSPPALTRGDMQQQMMTTPNFGGPNAPGFKHTVTGQEGEEYNFDSEQKARDFVDRIEQLRLLDRERGGLGAAKTESVKANEESKGLWANIHAKRERIKHGSGEHMRKPGSKGAPTASALRKSAK